MATALLIPQTTLSVGTRQFTTSNFSAVNNSWSITLNLVSWPLTGDVLQLIVEASLDGVNFQPDASIDLSAPQVDKHGVNVTSVSWTTTTIPGTTSLRLTTNTLQACTIGGSVSIL